MYVSLKKDLQSFPYCFALLNHHVRSRWQSLVRAEVWNIYLRCCACATSELTDTLDCEPILQWKTLARTAAIKLAFFFCCATLKRRREVFDRKLISGPVSKETDKVVNYTPRERRSTYKKFFLLNEKYLVPLIKFRIIRSKPTNNGSQAFELHILNIGIGTFFQSLLTEVLFITPAQRGIFTLNYATISWIGDRTLLEWL